MPPSDARYPRRGRRARGGRPIAPPENLEARELLAYSPLGVSLPDLTLQAYSAPVTSWGQPLAVTATVYNIGSSTITEPFNQIPAGQPNPYATFAGTAAGQPGTSSADSSPTVVDIFASTRPGKGPLVQVGAVNVPAISQNSYAVVSGDITLPARPAGFPSVGRIYLTYVVNGDNAVLEAGYSNNAFKSHQAVALALPLPNLVVTAFSVPSPLVPGQTITPVIQIANVGTAPTDSQGPVTVQVVASVNKNYGPGDKILATYVIMNIPPLSAVSTTLPFGDVTNLPTPANVVTLSSKSITLPATPFVYYVGVKVDPQHTIVQQGKHNSAMLDAYARVGPPILGLAPTLNTATSSTATTTVNGLYSFPNPVPGPATSDPTKASSALAAAPRGPREGG